MSRGFNSATLPLTERRRVSASDAAAMYGLNYRVFLDEIKCGEFPAQRDVNDEGEEYGTYWVLISDVEEKYRKLAAEQTAKRRNPQRQPVAPRT